MVGYASSSFFSYAIEAVQLPVNILNGDVTIVAFMILEQIRFNYEVMNWVANYLKVMQQVKPRLLKSTVPRYQMAFATICLHLVVLQQHLVGRCKQYLFQVYCLVQHESIDAALAVDNDTIINSPLSAIPAVIVVLPSILKPPDDIFEDDCCFLRILDEASHSTLYSKNISKMFFGTCVVGV